MLSLLMLVLVMLIQGALPDGIRMQPGDLGRAGGGDALAIESAAGGTRREKPVALDLPRTTAHAGAVPEHCQADIPVGRQHVGRDVTGRRVWDPI